MHLKTGRCVHALLDMSSAGLRPEMVTFLISIDKILSLELLGVMVMICILICFFFSHESLWLIFIIAMCILLKTCSAA